MFWNGISPQPSVFLFTSSSRFSLILCMLCNLFYPEGILCSSPKFLWCMPCFPYKSLFLKIELASPVLVFFWEHKTKPTLPLSVNTKRDPVEAMSVRLTWRFSWQLIPAPVCSEIPSVYFSLLRVFCFPRDHWQCSVFSGSRSARLGWHLILWGWAGKDLCSLRKLL